MNTAKVAWLRDAADQREKAHADGFASVGGNDGSEAASLLRPPVDELSFEGRPVDITLTALLGHPAKTRERRQILYGGFPH